MSQVQKRLSSNTAGNFFVDSTCINCDTCRQLAPEIFTEEGDFSSVHHQPENGTEERNALRALLACPTASIGTVEKSRAQEAMEDFPLPVEGEVYYCGFNSPKSFGGNSYFIRHAEGNWLVDSPKFLPHLVKKFKEAGGLKYIFLTHRDDVAEAAKYAAEFGSKRVIHEGDLSSQPQAEIVVPGVGEFAIGGEFKVIPTPGHTRGHAALLYRDRFLFTGDHLWWNREKNRLGASKSVCWHSWPQQIESMERLLPYSFEWVIPGHGDRVHLPKTEMKEELKALILRMKELI